MPDTPAYRPAPLFARFYEWISRRRFFAAQFDPLRRKLAQMSRGRVLEMGAGGGQNFPYYDPARVSAVEATEPDGTMLRYLRAHLQDSRVPIHVTEATAEHLPFDAHSFDTVQTTMVLCSVGDLGATLAEIARVLKPDGRLLLLEHVRSTRRGLAALQTAFTPIQRRVAGNCHLNRDMASALRDAGYAIETERRYGGGMFPLRLYAARPRLDGEPERVVNGPQTSA